MSIHQRFFAGFVLALAGGALVGVLATAELGEAGIPAAAGVFGVLLAAGIVAAHRLAGRISAPLRELEEAMHRVAEGDFSAAAPAPTQRRRDRVAGRLLHPDARPPQGHDDLAGAGRREPARQAGAARRGREARLARPGGRRRRPRDQQPAGGHQREGRAAPGLPRGLRRLQAPRALRGAARGDRRQRQALPHDHAPPARLRAPGRGHRRADRAQPGGAAGARVPRAARSRAKGVAARGLASPRGCRPRTPTGSNSSRSWSTSSRTPSTPSRRGGTIAIATRAKNQRWLQVAIADNGPGIPAEQLKQLFEPFFTTKEKGKGTGPRPLRLARDHEEARRPDPRRERGGLRDGLHAGAAGAARRPGDRR